MPGNYSLEPFMRALEEKDHQRSFLAATSLIDSKVIELGDFVFSSGLPSPMKIEMDNLRAHSKRMAEYLAEAIKLNPKRQGTMPDVVVGVISGGAWYARRVASILGARYAARLGTTDTPQKRSMEVGHFRQGDSVVIIEDVLTTAGNTIACADQVWQEGGIPFMVASIFDYDFPVARDMLAANNLLDINLVNFNSFISLLDKERWNGGAGFDGETVARIKHWHEIEAPAFFAKQG